MGDGRGRAPLNASSSVNAAALQQHFARSLNLGVGAKVGPKRGGGGGGPQGAPARGRGPSGRPARDEEQGLSRAEKERAKYESKLTLAERRGLARRPPSPLSESAWEALERRATERGAVAEGCPVCRDDFGGDACVLLSCGHAFHRDCVKSFEAFLVRQSELQGHVGVFDGDDGRACPCCRAKGYTRRPYLAPLREHERRAAVTIQKYARGHAGRKVAAHRRRTVPPRDAARRRIFYLDRLGEHGSRIEKRAEEEADSVDALFAQIDANLSYSRTVLGRADGTMESRRADGEQEAAAVLMTSAQEAVRADEELPVVGESGQNSEDGAAPDEVPAPGAKMSRAATARHLVARGWAEEMGLAEARATGVIDVMDVDGAVDWEAVRKKSRARGDRDCPICINPLSLTAVQKRMARQGRLSKWRRVCYLSCTHAFHEHCISAFEGFTRGALASGDRELVGPSSTGHTCPVCRAEGYTRRTFVGGI